MNESRQLNDQLTSNIITVLPLKAFPTRELVQELRKKDIEITLKTVLEIVSVYNSEEISGIMCVVECEKIKGLACALTHLDIFIGQPLYNEIIKYQKKRIKKLKLINQKTWN